MSIKLNKVAIYMRLSRDDDKAGESMSIENQRIILKKYADEHGGNIVGEYVDDGWSGTNFERPEVKRMLEDARSGKIDTIIVKDLSRFGRNYIQVGQYIDYIFPAYGIRFIAINDNVDTADRCSTAMDMMPIMNVFNEWHAANTSKKIRAVLEASQRSGKYTNWNYPYGYKAGTDENRTAVIDECAAAVVRRIYDLRLRGNSARAIAKILSDEGIPNPATYFTKLNGEKAQKNCSPYWVPKTVSWILKNQTYLGNTVQHKTTSVSYKNRKVVTVPENERIVKINAHEAIIDRGVWERVQAVNASPRGRADKCNRVHALSGLLVCPDCGKKLKFKSGRFVCRTYADLGKKYCTSHAVAENVLESIILRDIRSMSKGAFDERREKERFLRERAKKGAQNGQSDERQLKAYKNRLAELDKLTQSAFEDKVLKSLPESLFLSLMQKYNDERQIILESIEEIDKSRKGAPDPDEEAQEYVDKLKKHLSCESLTREICLQLIDFITIGEASTEGRNIEIFYKFSYAHK